MWDDATLYGSVRYNSLYSSHRALKLHEVLVGLGVPLRRPAKRRSHSYKVETCPLSPSRPTARLPLNTTITRSNATLNGLFQFGHFALIFPSFPARMNIRTAYSNSPRGSGSTHNTGDRLKCLFHHKGVSQSVTPIWIS